MLPHIVNCQEIFGYMVCFIPIVKSMFRLPEFAESKLSWPQQLFTENDNWYVRNIFMATGIKG